MSVRLLSICLSVLAAAALGCGDSAVGAPGAGAADAASCDADQIATCLVDQRACALADGAPRCDACGTGQYAASSGSCQALSGERLHHAFADFETQAGEEVLGLCQSWTLGNATDLLVNAVELLQNEASHHSNWTFVPEDKFDGPDGVWPCDDRDYDQLSAALVGGVIYAQSTQAPHEVQKFPDGAVVRIPAHSRIIGDVHLLNTTKSPVSGHVELTLYSIDPAEAHVRLAPFHMTYEGLAIPPHASSRFTGECELDSKFEGALDQPMTMTVYYALPHTHAQGRRFFFEVMGGPHDGESILDVRGFNGEPRGRLYEPPLSLEGATGLRFGCEFDNPRAEAIHWGFGDQEMCEMLGFADMGIAFESSVATAEPAGTDGAMPLYTGPCSTLTIPWASKQGN